MGSLRRKAGILAAILGMAAAAAVVWFCLAGGKMKEDHGGTLVRLNGAPCTAAEIRVREEAA